MITLTPLDMAYAVCYVLGMVVTYVTLYLPSIKLYERRIEKLETRIKELHK